MQFFVSAIPPSKGDRFMPISTKRIAALALSILLLATMAPTQPYLTLGIVVAFMIVMNLLLFRSFIFKKRK